MISVQTLVKYYKKKVHIEHFNLNLNDNLLTLYAQARGITLAPPVLPRRLARVFAGAPDKKQRCIITNYPFYSAVAIIYYTTSLGRPLDHCPRFPTAASNRSQGLVSVPMWLNNLSVQLSMIGLVSC